MTISYKWLMEYLPQPVAIQELSIILTSIGLEVEAIEPVEMIKGSLQGLVIGKVRTCTQHPNADKLSLTTVDIGAEAPLQIVCGAPNVAAGQHVVVAPVGTTVYPLEGAPFLIQKAKIRNEASAGMICAEDEIGLGQSHAGIIVLPETAPVGMAAKDFFQIPEPDFAIHIGLTPNRSDAMSHIGVARDVCAYLAYHNGTNQKVKKPTACLPPPQAHKPMSIRVTAAEACPRYAGIVLTDVHIASSPEWLQQRLQTIGVRPINNVVDITNFVLHEYGQPLHAFDYDKINGAAINVRFPQATDSPFITLDEKERKLAAHDLMICDADKALCIAGVFGGLNSGITEHTTTIFLESAYFTPAFIRRTSLHHNLRTDAAAHFEKGVDSNNILPALERAAQLITELASAKMASPIVDIYPQPIAPAEITFTYRYIRNLCGKEYSPEAIAAILTALQFEIVHTTDEGMTVKTPLGKTDCTQPADVAEEILRIDGLDNIAIPARLNMVLSRPLPTDRQAREQIANALSGMGFQELITNSIVSSKFHPDRKDLVYMRNSLSSELNIMRPSMAESGLEVILYNCNRKNQDLFLFELGKIYFTENDCYREEPRLAIWVTGKTRPAQWHQKAEQADIYYLKGLIEKLLAQSNINAPSSIAGETMVWKWKNQILATAAAIPAKRLQEFDLKQAVFYADLNWDLWYQAAVAHKITYAEIPKYPAVQRDLAIVLNQETPYSEVQKVTNQVKLAALRSYGLFDAFENEKLGTGKKSLALNYTFRLDDRTLTDAEIEQYMNQLIKAYETKLQAQIRS